MPSYRTHVSVNLFLALPAALAALKYTVQSTPADWIWFGGAFIYGTLFLHPDLDLARNIRLFSLKGLLTLPFRPYSYLFRHRGISHWPIIGTLTRVAWLLAIFYCLGWTFPHFPNSAMWLCIGGIASADLSHILLDWIK